ncbi:MAG: ABC transporter substrate-binding protein [bacterium]|nr:ABC transporter substrate-binding protein [bacterium]
MNLIFVVLLFVANTYPQRIISLGPVVTEELYLLEVNDKLVANTIYCQIPQDAQKKEKIGTLMEINIEKIVSLKPDLVLATPLNNPKQLEKLKNMGINVINFSSPENFQQICEQFLKLGNIVGKEFESIEIINQTAEKIDSICKKVENLPKPKVFIEVGANPLFTAPKHSFIHNLIELGGGINVGVDTKNGLYSREKVLKQNPDIIIIITMGVVGEQEKEIWQKYKTINAVKNNKIYVLDSYRYCSPTPVVFVEALEELVGLFHPGVCSQQTEPLNEKTACQLATDLANQECERIYGTRPFLSEHYKATFFGERWQWGQMDAAGIKGYSAEVSFKKDGTDKKVQVFFSTDRLNRTKNTIIKKRAVR